MTTNDQIEEQEKRVTECRNHLGKSREFYELCRQKTIKEKEKLLSLKAKVCFIPNVLFSET